jgi:putative transcriptional regulator
MILKNNIRALRFNKNRMTQAGLAEAVDVSRQTIIAIEQGKFNPSVKLALRIAKFFGNQVEEVFYLNKEE